MKRRFPRKCAEACTLELCMIQEYFSIPVPIRRHSGGRKLLEKGIDATKIITDTFYEKSMRRIQIMGRALMESFPVYGRKMYCVYTFKESDGFLRCKSQKIWKES